MKVEMVKEHEDGSATFTFDMDDSEIQSIVVFGLRRALEEAIARGEEWHDTDVVHKPVVRYHKFVGLKQWPGEDFMFYAKIEGVLDHPILGNEPEVRTSLLVTLPDKDGNFETMNTKYVKVKDE